MNERDNTFHFHFAFYVCLHHFLLLFIDSIDSFPKQNIPRSTKKKMKENVNFESESEKQNENLEQISC